MEWPAESVALSLSSTKQDLMMQVLLLLLVYKIHTCTPGPRDADSSTDSRRLLAGPLCPSGDSEGTWAFSSLFSSRHLPCCCHPSVCVPADDDNGADASTRVRQSLTYILPAYKETLRLCSADTHTNVFIPPPIPSQIRTEKFYFILYFQSNSARRSLIILTCQNSVPASAGLCWSSVGGLISSIVYPIPVVG
jgi:hypothetical protein